MTAIVPFEEARLAVVNRKQAAEMEARKAALEAETRKATFSATTQYMHGNPIAGGLALLNQPGADPRVISTMQGPLGMADLIPVYPSQTAIPVLEMLTAQGDVTGSEATDMGTRGKIVGKMKVVRLTAPFGRIIRSSEDLSPDKLGLYVNRAEPLDLTLINDVGGSSPWIPEAARNLSLTDEIRTQLWKVGFEYRRVMEKLTWQGAGTSVLTNAGYQEFYGLETLNNSGKTDMFTQSVVKAADPKVIAWNAAFDASVTVENKSMDLIEAMSRVDYYVQLRADGTDMSPAAQLLAMRRDLFTKLVLHWPYSYLTAGPAATTSKLVSLDAGDMTAMRDAMRSGQFLTINGRNIPVVFSDGITESATGSGVKSDIHWLTIAAGGMRMLYYEYFNWANEQIASFRQMLPEKDVYISDAGKYLWANDRSYAVMNFQAYLQPRLILRAAYLCARITGVQYDSALHGLDGMPGSIYDQLSLADGGVQTGSYGTGIYSGSV